mgnify:FL=1
MAKEVLEMEVKSDIKNVTKDTQAIIDAIKEAAAGAKDLGNELDDSGKKGGKGIKKISLSFKGLMKAAGIVFLITKAFEIFKETLGKNQKVVDFFNTAMTAVSIVFNDLFKFIESNVGPITEYFKALFEDPGTKVKELGDAIKQGLVDRFNEFLEVMGLVGKAFGQLIDGEFGAAFDTIKEAGKQVVDVYTGVDDSFEKVKETIKKGITAVKEYTKSTIEQAVSVTESAKAAGRAAVQFAMLNAQYLKEAEDQRKIRDNVNLSFQERIEANEKLSEVIKKQQKLQKEQVQTQIDAAQKQYNINASEENWIALQETKVAMLEVVEATEAQLSEQLTNQVGLENELLEVKKELGLVGLGGVDLELAELKTSYEAKLEMARKSGEDITAITAEYEAQQTEIIEAGAEAQKDIDAQVAATKVDYFKQGLQVIQSIMDVQSQQTENNYQAELEMAEGNAEAIEGIEEKYDGIRRAEAAKHQKMQIAMALVDTYQSAVSAYANAIKIPGIGIAMAPYAAGLAVAAGLANVAMISKQQNHLHLK